MVEFFKALSIAQADLKSKESILNPRDNRCLYLRFLVGLDLACLQRFRESIETLESLMKELPESTHYFLVLQIVSSLGGSYNCLKEYRTSLNLCKEVMERFGDCFKDQCLDVLSIYLVMGEALSGLERPKEALTWSTKAVLGFQKHYGMAHSRTSAAMEYLARNYQALNDIEKACDWQEKSVNLIRDILGTNHPSTILQEEQLIDYVDRRRRTPLSRKKILGRRKACLDQLSKQVGDKHFRTLDCQARLAQDYFFCGLLKKAMLMQEICVEAMIQEYGQDDGRTAEVIAQLATTKRWIKIRKIVYWWVPNGLLK
jgi:tetratricopeptide (TPR) repeat protein